MNYLCVKNRGEGEKKKFNIVSGLEEVYKRGCRPVIRIVLQLRRGRRLFRSHVVLRPLPRIFIGRLYEFRKLQQLQQVLYLYKWASFYTLLPDRYRNLLPSLLSFSDTKLKTCVARDPTSLLHLNNALLIWQLRMWVIKLRMRVIFGQYITIIYLFICTGTYRWIANLWKMSNCIWGMSRVTIFQNCIVPSRYQGPWIELELYKLYNNFFFNNVVNVAGPRVLFANIIPAARYSAIVRPLRTNVLREKDHQVSSQHELLFPVHQTVHIFPRILHETSPWPKIDVASLHGEGGKIRHRPRKQNGCRVDWTEQKGKGDIKIIDPIFVYNRPIITQTWEVDFFNNMAEYWVEFVATSEGILWQEIHLLKPIAWSTILYPYPHPRYNYWPIFRFLPRDNREEEEEDNGEMRRQGIVAKYLLI